MWPTRRPPPVLPAGEDDSLCGVFEYSTDLLDLATVERTVDHLGRLLVQLTAAPDMLVGAAALISEDEWRADVVEWNRTDDAALADLSVIELYERRAACDTLAGGRGLIPVGPAVADRRDAIGSSLNVTVIAGAVDPWLRTVTLRVADGAPVDPFVRIFEATVRG